MGEPKTELATKHESVSETLRVLILKHNLIGMQLELPEEIPNVGMLPLLFFKRL